MDPDSRNLTPAEIVSRILNYLQDFLWRTTLLLQIFEWTAVLYIIKIQDNKHIGEIYFEHNAENIDKLSVASGEISNRRFEKTEKNIFIACFVFISLMHVALDTEVYHS